MQRKALEAGLGRPDADVDELRGIIDRTGARSRTEERITELTDQALHAIEEADLQTEAREALTALAGAATQRSR